LTATLDIKQTKRILYILLQFNMIKYNKHILFSNGFIMFGISLYCGIWTQCSSIHRSLQFPESV